MKLFPVCSIYFICLFLLFAPEAAPASTGLLQSLLLKIERTEHGRQLLKDARKRDPDFMDKVKLSHVSHTETVFSRAYSLDSNREILQVEKFIQLRENMPFLELLYDFVHELVHFTYQEPQNPYNFSSKIDDFIQNGISGRGGELEAFQMECFISWELETQESIPSHRLCDRYRGAGEDIFLSKVAEREFYTLGSYYRELSHLQEELPFLSKGRVRFRSSLNMVPYPIYFRNEFISLRKQACDNNRRKKHLLASFSASASSRNIADPSALEKTQPIKERKKLDERFCQKIWKLEL